MNETITKAIAVAVQADVPVHIVGAPGTAKTSIGYAIVHGLGWPLEVVIASIRDTTDFGGLPKLTDEGVQFLAPRWAAAHVKDDTPYCIIFDEISTAPPAVQAGCLRVILEKWVGDTYIPMARFMAISNPPEQAAGGWDLAPPMANRFCHLDWTIDPDVWIQGMVSGWDVESCIPHLGREWESLNLASNKVLISSFIRTKRHLLLQVPKDESKAGGPWPSPRSWSMAARLKAAAESAECSKDVALLLISGCVGSGPAVEMLAYLDNLDLPDTEEILARPALFSPDGMRDDQLFTIVNSVVSATIQKMTEARWLTCWEIMGKVASSKGSADIAAGSVGALLKHRGKDFQMNPKFMKPFIPLIEQLKK